LGFSCCFGRGCVRHWVLRFSSELARRAFGKEHSAKQSGALRAYPGSQNRDPGQPDSFGGWSCDSRSGKSEGSGDEARPFATTG
jgi:hypothetical protein